MSQKKRAEVAEAKRKEVELKGVSLCTQNPQELGIYYAVCSDCHTGVMQKRFCLPLKTVFPGSAEMPTKVEGRVFYVSRQHISHRSQWIWLQF